MEDYTIDLGEENNSLSETWKDNPERMEELVTIVTTQITRISKDNISFPEAVKNITSQAKNPLELYTLSQYISVAFTNGIAMGVFTGNR